MAIESEFMNTMRGKLVTLLDSTTVAAGDDGSVDGAWVTNLQGYTRCTLMLTVSAKTMDASTTLDVRVQYSPDEGTTADDIVAFAQITNEAVANGKYIVVLNGVPVAGATDKAVANGTLAAGTLINIPWCDRMRVKYTKAKFAGTDTVTIKVQGYFQA